MINLLELIFKNQTIYKEDTEYNYVILYVITRMIIWLEKCYWGEVAVNFRIENEFDIIRFFKDI